MRVDFVWNSGLRGSYVLIEWGYTWATMCRCGCPVVYRKQFAVPTDVWWWVRWAWYESQRWQ